MYKTVKELAAAVAESKVTGTLVIDNDEVYFYDDNTDECVFRDHPGTVLEHLLDMAGIPWEPV